MSSLPAFLVDTPLPGLGRPLTASEVDQTSKYVDLLIKWQRVHRLVGSTEVAWIAQNVIVDSLAFLAVLPGSMRCLADVGSGAGIPGIPIAIVRLGVDIVLVEARQRRVSFLSTVVRELGLSHVHVAGVRVEELANAYADRFDAVVMRCAGPVLDIVPKVLPIVRSGGIVVASASSTPGGVAGGERLVLRSADGGTRWFRRWIKP